MKVGWQVKKLGEVCVVDKCQGIHKNLPYVGLEHIESQTGQFVGSTEPLHVKSSTFKFSPEHVLYGRLRPYLNKVMLPDFTGHCSTEIFPFKPRPGLSRKFLQYWFLRKATVEQIDATSTGTRMPRANMNAVLDFEFPLPPLPEQHRIVALLDQAFDGIASAKAQAEQNLQNARALFESHLQAVFTERGEGWEDSTLGGVLATLRNGMNCKQDKSGNGTMVSRIESIWNAEFDITRVGYADVSPAQKEKFLLHKGDILFSHINSAIHVGKTAVFNEEEEVVHGVNLLLMRPKPELSAVFLDLYLKSIFTHGYWRRVCKQSINQASVNQQDINLVPIRFPGIELQKKISGQMAALREETQRLESLYQRKLAALDDLKKSLLHQAFSGHL